MEKRSEKSLLRVFRRARAVMRVIAFPESGVSNRPF